jgi:hypothetical protein
LIGGHFVFIFGPTFTAFLVYPVFSGRYGNLAFPALPVHRVTWDRPAVPAYPDFPPIHKSKRLNFSPGRDKKINPTKRPIWRVLQGPAAVGGIALRIRPGHRLAAVPAHIQLERTIFYRIKCKMSRKIFTISQLLSVDARRPQKRQW